MSEPEPLKRTWEVARGVLVIIVSTALISSAVSLYRLASSVGPFTRSIPPGAVVAFDSESCPRGWTPYTRGAGRFLIGAGRHSEHNGFGTEVPVKVPGATGGEDQAVLTIDQMPRHRHQNPTEGGSGTGRTSALRATDNGNVSDDGRHAHARPTAHEGGGQPHDIMPPWVALTFCSR